MNADLYDVTIIGGGPVGLYAAYYAGFRTLRTKIVESLDALGGQITALYPEKPLFDVAGFPHIVGRELVDTLVAQAMQYHPTVCTGETVDTLTRAVDGTLCLVTQRATHATRVLLIAAGIGAFHPKTFEQPKIDSFEGKGLYYFVKRFQDFIRVTPRMETNLPRVYAAGDIVTFPGKVKLITTGFGEAATAINNAAQYLNPKASVFPGHSSSQAVHAKQRETAAAA